MASSDVADQVSESILTLPLMVPGSVATVTVPLLPTSESATVVVGGSGSASFWYPFTVTAVVGIATTTAMTGDHHVNRMSGNAAPIRPRMTRTRPGMTMNAPGLNASIMRKIAPTTIMTIAIVNGSMPVHGVLSII